MKKAFTIILCLTAIIAILLAAGCNKQPAAAPQTAQPQKVVSNVPASENPLMQEKNSEFGNMTNEEVMKIYIEMRKNMAESCKGKTAGVPCSVLNAVNQTLNGTCRMQNTTLMCMGSKSKTTN